MQLEPVSPHQAVLRILAVRFGEQRPPPDLPGLTAFQCDAVERLRGILHTYRGAILADSVGLGKTHVARTIAADVIASGGRVLVCGPAHLRQHWKRHMRPLRAWDWVSHTSLSRGAQPRGASLIVIDEGHAFRNPRTRRYAALSALTANADVLMLTATPVNNGVMDFYHLVRLFARRDAFVGIGVPDALSAADAAMRGDRAGIARIADAVVVRRTRDALRAWPTGNGDARFPRLDGVRTLQYDAAHDAELLSTLQQVSFAAHAAASDGAAAPLLLRYGLLKRLESSAAAFDASVRRHIALLAHFSSAAERGLLFSPAVDSDLLLQVDRWAQVPLQELMLRRWPAALDAHDFVRRARVDLVLLQRLRLHCNDGDVKLARLLEVLRQHAAERVVIFTEYRETAVHLWNALAPRGAVALVHGGEARLGRSRAARSTVIERFAPVSNGCRPPPAHQRVDVLIATDVIAEGMNLQDASVVISYDLPWNPVRLAQRIGRIDRLGSPHERVFAYAFAPAPAVDNVIEIMRRLRRKIRQIRAVGGDAPRFVQNSRRAIIHSADAGEVLRMRARITSITQLDRPVLAAAESPSGEEAVMTCWQSGNSARFVLIAGGRARELPLPEADALLLAAIDAEARPLPPIDVRRVVRQSRSVLQRRNAHTLPASVATRVSRAVGRWLRTRQHVSNDDIAAAERVLCGIDALGPASERELEQLLTSRNADDVIRRAATLIGDGAATVRPARVDDDRLIAVIALVPGATPA
jgi:superfamily II DNA or RNA helicase